MKYVIFLEQVLFIVFQICTTVRSLICQLDSSDVSSYDVIIM